jgi:putative acetyltransferase
MNTDKFAQVSAATQADYPDIIHVWELSVRATHHFLPEDYLQRIKGLLPTILPHVMLFVTREAQGTVNGFMGVSDDKIEMLFVHPDFTGKGLGKLLTGYAIEVLGRRKVDVNEENEAATRFYQKMGFVQIGRTETDGLGKPHPILQLELKAG